VSNSDGKLVSDIEKLIKKKIDVEIYPLPSFQRRDRSERDHGSREGRSEHSRDQGRSRRHEEGDAGYGSAHSAGYRPVGRGMARPLRAAPSDPFFDKPYEAPAAAAAPAAWDAASAPVTPGRSASIRTKRKVAALFKPAGSF
jgi:hypothetical protein